MQFRLSTTSTLITTAAVNVNRRVLQLETTALYRGRKCCAPARAGGFNTHSFNRHAFNDSALRYCPRVYVNTKKSRACWGGFNTRAFNTHAFNDGEHAACNLEIPMQPELITMTGYPLNTQLLNKGLLN